MRKNTKYCVDEIVKKHRNEPKRPLNVERQIERFWKKENQEKRETIYEYIQLERIISEYGKL